MKERSGGKRDGERGGRDKKRDIPSVITGLDFLGDRGTCTPVGVVVGKPNKSEND